MKRPFVLGNHKVRCDICKKVRYNTEVRMQWDGQVACANRCWSRKHPNEFPRPVIVDGLPVPNARPAPSIESMPVVSYNQMLTTWETANWDDPTWIWSDNPGDSTGYFGNANLS